MGFDCRVLYQRAQCAINIDSPGERLNNNLSVVSRELAKVRDNGLLRRSLTRLSLRKASSCRSCLPPMRALTPTF
ncbi:protein YhjJ, putative peptidase [Klebsiella pneumoniae]|uniref:Protein YhjJ, putative peptidase n=1 Tax=Klebsiella pneumoniae TaxID=573 RepID=A0A2X3CWT5_KLEPN|nr:protein YhjJ, putative peptidase [Klebsiella pneumoniae]